MEASMESVLSKHGEARFDLYQRVTDQVIAAIEAGAGNFEMPWHSTNGALRRPRNVVSGAAYQGINILALWSQALVKGYHSSLWGTYRQWQEMGWQVRKGEKATVVVYYRQLPEFQDEAEGSADAPEYRLIARAFFVFNACQMDGWRAREESTKSSVEPCEEIEQLVEMLGAMIRYGGDVACYRPRDDYIELPDRERFTGTSTSSPTEAFYATLLHELVHWSGHPKRLNRDLSGRFGSEAYAMEELVAELGAAFLSAEFQVSNAPRPDHAAYVAHWLRVLKNDKRAIFLASRLATEAVNGLLPQ
jgi:antirestriction protein ArdC